MGFDPEGPGATVRFKRLVRSGANPFVTEARHDPQTGEQVAWPGIGGSVALVAIRSAETNTGAWWRPDGQEAAGLDCTVEYPQPLGAADARRFDLLFRIQCVPLPAEAPVFDFPRAIRSAADGRALVRGVLEGSRVPAQVVWPAEEASATARVGIPRGRWHTIRSFEPISRSFTKTRLNYDPNWEIEMHAAGDGTKGAQITMIFNKQYLDWNLRVIATRTRGADVPGVADARSGIAPAITTTYAFAGVKLDEIQNFQVQAQPLEWAEFNHLKLAATKTLNQP